MSNKNDTTKYPKIIKIGTWDSNGNPTEWTIGGGMLGSTLDCLSWEDEGRVLVGDVEIVEWTEARRAAMER